MSARALGVSAMFAIASIACGSSAPNARPDVGLALSSSVGAASPSAPPSAPSASSATPSKRLPEVEGPAIQSLDVDGFLAASIAVPVGAADPRPIVVAVHGNADRASWQCEVWSVVFRSRAFVLCPAGRAAGESSPGDPRFTFSHALSLEKEIDAGLAALRASAFAPWLKEGPVVYAGFSLGAMMGVSIATRRASDFPTVILVEGGLEKLSPSDLQRFADGGGKRILFACAEGRVCADASQRFADLLTSYGARGTAVWAGPVGHRYDGPVADAIAAALPAFLADDPTWTALLAQGDAAREPN